MGVRRALAWALLGLDALAVPKEEVGDLASARQVLRDLLASQREPNERRRDFDDGLRSSGRLQPYDG
jgi:hypothetical protein